MEVSPFGPLRIQSEEFRASRAGNLHDGGETVMLLLRMMLLQPLVLHQLVHQLLAIPPRTGAMWLGGFLCVSQSGPTVPGTAMLPRVLSKHALGPGGRSSLEGRLASMGLGIHELGGIFRL